MRTATLAVGFTGTGLILVAAFFKVMHWPGASIGLILGFCLIAIVYQVLQTIYVIREKVPGIFIASRLVSAVAVWMIASGLLFRVQHWPGAFVVLVDGIVVGLVALLLFGLSIRKNSELVRKHLFFSIPALFALLLMSGLSGITGAYKAKQDADVKDYYNQQGLFGVEYVTLLNMTTDHYEDSLLRGLSYKLRAAEKANFVLADIQSDITSRQTGYSKEVLDTMYNTRPEIKWDDYDTPTHIIVGKSPNAPTGKGKLIVAVLREFQTDYLPDEIKMDVDLPADNRGDAKWIADHFYHKTTLETFTTLLKFREEIINGAIRSIRENKFRANMGNNN